MLSTAASELAASLDEQRLAIVVGACERRGPHPSTPGFDAQLVAIAAIAVAAAAVAATVECICCLDAPRWPCSVSSGAARWTH